MSGCDSATAHISAVLVVSVVAALTAAPCTMSASTTSTLPVRAAVISGVRPLVRAMFGSAPAFSNVWTIARLAFSVARSSGVTPWPSTALTSAPARKSTSAVSRSSQWAAQRRAVAPSARAVLTSMPWSTSSRTVPMSCSAAALTSLQVLPGSRPQAGGPHYRDHAGNSSHAATVGHRATVSPKKMRQARGTHVLRLAHDRHRVGGCDEPARITILPLALQGHSR